MNKQDRPIYLRCLISRSHDRLCYLCPKVRPEGSKQKHRPRFARWLYLDFGPVCKHCRPKLEQIVRETAHTLRIRQPKFETIKELPAAILNNANPANSLPVIRAYLTEKYGKRTNLGLVARKHRLRLARNPLEIGLGRP